MRLAQLFEAQEDKVAPEVKRDFRRVMMELSRFFHGEVAPFSPTSPGALPNYFRFMNADDPVSEVRVQLVKMSEDLWAADIVFFYSNKTRLRNGGGVLRDAHAKIREVKNHFGKIARVSNVFTGSSGGSFKILLPLNN